MALINLLLFLGAIAILTKSAEYAMTYSHKLARIFRLPDFIISFFIVAVISCFPEATISIISSLEGNSAFGLGTLLGSNVADLTLVFGLVALFSYRGIKIKSAIIKKDILYLLLLIFPLILGIDGKFSRIDGMILVLSGLFFFLTLSIEGHMFRSLSQIPRNKEVSKNTALLIISLIILIFSAYYTIEFGTRFAQDIGLPVFIISLTFVSIGTCLPELIFSIKAVKANHEGLAMGDILGTVITDATIVLGIMCLINPFEINPTIMLITGTAMAIAALLIIAFSRTELPVTKKEGIFLIFFYIVYLFVEFIGNKVI